MRLTRWILLACALLSLAGDATAQQGSTAQPKAGTASPSPLARDKRGRLARSVAAKREFMKSTGYPRGWPGHVVDHIIPLACGGRDSPANMQWQTTADARMKDKSERRGCGKRR